MIKANELRIGNILNLLIKNEMGGEVKSRVATSLSIDAIKDICERSDADDFWESIPLTPEWLERCGFKDGEIRPSYKLHMDVRPYETATQGIFPGEWAVTLVDAIPHQLGNTIRYVHQLQNLYFACQGEELKIEL
jgi:hypothetical protein